MARKRTERKKLLYFHQKKKKSMVDLPILLANFHTEAENVVGRVHEELKLRMGNMLKIFSNLSLNIRIFIMLVRKKPCNIITGLPFSFFFFL